MGSFLLKKEKWVLSQVLLCFEVGKVGVVSGVVVCHLHCLTTYSCIFILTV